MAYACLFGLPYREVEMSQRSFASAEVGGEVAKTKMKNEMNRLISR